MSNFFETLAAIGFLIATAISVWVIILEPIYQDAAVVSSSMVAVNPDPRCVPHPVKFPCLINPARS